MHNMQRFVAAMVLAAMSGQCLAQRGGGSSTSTGAREAELQQLVERLMADITMLKERVEELETRLAAVEMREGNPAENDPALDDPDRARDTRQERLMIVESVEALAPDPQARERVAAFLPQISEKEKLAQKYEEQRTKLYGCHYWPHHCHCADNEAHRHSELDRKRKREEFAKLALKARQDARKLEGEAKRIERESLVARHEIRGWDGQRTVVLHTEKDCSTTLSKVTAGGYLTWTGRILDSNDDLQNWSVTRVEIVTGQPAIESRTAAAQGEDQDT